MIKSPLAGIFLGVFFLAVGLHNIFLPDFPPTDIHPHGGVPIVGGLLFIIHGLVRARSSIVS